MNTENNRPQTAGQINAEQIGTYAPPPKTAVDVVQAMRQADQIQAMTRSHALMAQEIVALRQTLQATEGVLLRLLTYYQSRDLEKLEILQAAEMQSVLQRIKEIPK